MSGLEIAGLALAALPLAISILTSAGYTYRKVRFGISGHFLYATRIVDTDALERLHVQINTWTDEQALAWKSSQLSTYNAISVASAIFASVGITTWQLGDITSVHWIVRALTGASTILGVLSVATATHQYQKINQLDSALSVRLWLSTSEGRAALPEGLRIFIELLRPSTVTGITKVNKYKNFGVFGDFPLESSIVALKMVALPGYLLYLAVVLFLVGFLLYPMFMWLDNIDDAGYAYRNIFVFFIAVTSFGVLYWMSLFMGQTINNAARNRLYDLGGLAGPLERTAELEDLKSRLAYCQALLSQPEPATTTGSTSHAA